MSYETLLTSVTDGVARITLNRPEARNALSRAMVSELEQALAAYEADAGARVIVLAGAGDTAFCAGADLKGAGDRGTTLQARELFGGLARILESMARMRTPVIAQVGCDVVIASEDATFGLPEIKLGLLPLIVMAPVLRAAGLKRGLPLVLSGESITAREAFEIGLVSRVVPRAELERATMTLARRVAALSPTAVAIAKKASSTIQDMEYAKALRYLRELTTLVFMSDDAREGISAFFDKRQPEWKGR